MSEYIKNTGRKMTEEEFTNACRKPPFDPPRKAKEGYYWVFSGELKNGHATFKWQECEYSDEPWCCEDEE